MIINANAMSVPLADQSVHCIVTSPPYWGLRDYGTATWAGGDAGCDHKLTTARNDGGRENINGFHGSSRIDSDKGAMNYRSICGKCGAIRIDNQLGLERTPDCGSWLRGKHEPYIDYDEDNQPIIKWRRVEKIVLCGKCYVCRMVAVFRECWRVLRDDGTLWLNIGDSYAGNGSTNSSGGPSEKQASNKGAWFIPRSIDTGLKPKDLVGIPWRLAFALQADGWYLRSDIIWSKPNPMPESVTDRPTKAHEYLFLLSKRERYYYDAEAVREPQIDFERGANGQRVGWDDTERVEPGNRRGTAAGIDRDGNKRAYNPAGRNRRTVWNINQPIMKLRSDLSDDDRAYVLGELYRRGLLSNTPSNTSVQPESFFHNQDTSEAK